jgi:2,4-didehydro-3-deoxy-L-rhamnonate hydrolase
MRLGVANDRLVMLSGGHLVDVATASSGRFGPDPHAAFARWEALTEWSAAHAVTSTGLDVRHLQNPVPMPRQVFAVGANYRDHVDESGAEVPSAPLIFTKFPSCLSGPHSPIPLPSRKVDWEAELVVVMGQRAEHVREEHAWGHVAGLTVGQDITERAVQLAGPYPQFSMGKSFPGFGPVGPVVVTRDEFDDPDDLALGCAVNGQVMQQSRTKDMIFTVPEVIARLSAVCPLLPGDLIFTGTPAGVGAFRSPRVFLRPGDILTTWVEGIGEIRNEIVAGRNYDRSSVTERSDA